MDSVPKSDPRMGYGNKGYSNVEMDRVGKLDKNGHQKQNTKDKREVYSGLTFERENQKGNVYEQLGNTKNPDKTVENKYEETEYSYISDVDFAEAQKQSQSPTPAAKPVPASPTEVPQEGMPNLIKTNPKVLAKVEPRTYMSSNTKPLPKAPTSNSPSYDKMGRFGSGKYSAIGNPAYSSDVKQLSLQNQAMSDTYEEPVTVQMSTPRKGAVETPDDGYFKLEPMHRK
ncbi:uncharacterized protein LOC117331539 [Pecten maximus]|uniref:uncharacterized protein LOC117331539 n=1 Tax=Pecten maximus TaxID=6579 RepID=UPI00145862CA|nr:uncharacterized protein LOC117331539 [Pecten maximus]